MAFNPFRRLGLKVVSVVLAALIWLVVSGEQIVERGFRIPLEFSNLPAGLVCDLIEEYGRHTGHADLLREAVDGLVGEDPPPGWCGQ